MLYILHFALMVSFNIEMQRKTSTTKKDTKDTANLKKVRIQGSGIYQDRIIQQDLLPKNK